MNHDEPFEPEEHELSLDIVTADDCECANCDGHMPKGSLLVNFSRRKSAFGWILCIDCARRKLEAFLPIWEERERRATVTT